MLGVDGQLGERGEGEGQPVQQVVDLDTTRMRAGVLDLTQALQKSGRAGMC